MTSTLGRLAPALTRLARAEAASLAGLSRCHRQRVTRWQLPSRGTASGQGPAMDAAEEPSPMELAVQEQRLVMFPGLRQLEDAQRQQDVVGRRTAEPSGNWSPNSLPYKVHEKDAGLGEDSDEDSDSNEVNAETEDGSLNGGHPHHHASPTPPDATPLDASPASTEAPVSTEDTEVDGLQVGMEEVGFRYKGPEPTLYGDWAHKGRVSDF